jgi:hypothetical protein
MHGKILMAMGAVDGVLAFLAGQAQHRFATGTFLKHMGFAERPFVSQQTALSPYGGGQCQPAGVLTLPSGNVA